MWFPLSVVAGNRLKIAISSIGILIIALSLSIYFNLQLKSEINYLKDSSAKLQSNLNYLKEQFDLLSAQNKNLSLQNTKITEDSISLTSQMQSVQEETDKVLTQLKEFEITVQDSISWFKQNIDIGTHEEYKEMRAELDSCISYSDSCSIDLNCINRINDDNRFRYQIDELTSKKEDFLQDLSQIFSHKGGDCEDFSLLFRAEYNYLLNSCLKNYSRGQIYSKTEENLINKTYMYIVCGTWEPNELSGFAGHCMVELTKLPINSTNDVYLRLNEGTLIEPQNGLFEGEVNDLQTIKVFDNGVAPDTLYYIYFAITDDDLMIFDAYSDEVGWSGYHDMLNNAELLKTKVTS